MMGLFAVRAVTVNISSLAETSALWMMLSVKASPPPGKAILGSLQYEVSSFVDDCRERAGDDYGGGGFLDNGGAAELSPGRQEIPAVYRSAHAARVSPEHHSIRPLQLSGARSRGFGRLRPRLPYDRHPTRSQVHQFHRAFEAESIFPFVKLIESGPDRVDLFCAEWPFLDRHGESMFLAVVAEVGGSLHLNTCRDSLLSIQGRDMAL